MYRWRKSRYILPKRLILGRSDATSLDTRKSYVSYKIVFRKKSLSRIVGHKNCVTLTSCRQHHNYHYLHSNLSQIQFCLTLKSLKIIWKLISNRISTLAEMLILQKTIHYWNGLNRKFICWKNWIVSSIHNPIFEYSDKNK